MSFVCVYILKKTKNKKTKQNKKIQKKIIQDFQIFPKKREKFSKKKSLWTRGIEPLSHFLKEKKFFELGALDFLVTFSKKTHFFLSKISRFFKFFFRNRKLWFSSIFSSGARSSQFSTLSIYRSMEYVPNKGHSPGMPKSFQWITLLLIESIYFAGTRVKGPHTSVWIMPSKNPSDLWEACPNFKSMDLWEAHPKFKSLDL